jgi:hypothetical protein
MLLPCCFAFLAGCCRVTRKAKSTPMTRHSYQERDRPFSFPNGPRHQLPT